MVTAHFSEMNNTVLIAMLGVCFMLQSVFAYIDIIFAFPQSLFLTSKGDEMTIIILLKKTYFCELIALQFSTIHIWCSGQHPYFKFLTLIFTVEYISHKTSNVPFYWGILYISHKTSNVP